MLRERRGDSPDDQEGKTWRSGRRRGRLGGPQWPFGRREGEDVQCPCVCECEGRGTPFPAHADRAPEERRWVSGLRMAA